jgi:uncharacterized protein YyaL (SSP411 family)
VDGVEQALLHMAQGGIYDHLGGGFARYAVDRRWLVPHFEKMLYDNALLVDLMTEVWKERRHPLLQERVSETVAWLLREMIAPDGGFASSWDADSEGEEGRFYVWTKAEIVAVLGEADAAFFAEIYDVTDEGNWEGGTILNRLSAMELLSPAQEDRLAELRTQLFEHRRSRVLPGHDDKVLADWNGLAIVALVNAGQAFGETAWIEAARTAYRFVAELMQRDGRLMHSYRGGQAKTPAVATDYAMMIAAAIALHLATGDAAPLSDAERWEAILRQHYRAETGGYYLSADDTRDIAIRTLSARDDATPSANSVMLGNLTALYLLTGDARYRDEAEALRRGFVGEALALATLHTGFFGALADHLTPKHLVLIHGRGEEAMRDALSRISLPGVVVQWIAEGGDAAKSSPAYGKRSIEGSATGYLCHGTQCSAPVASPGDLLALLRSHRIEVLD